MKPTERNYCVECGTKLSGSRRFCSECGTLQDRPETQATRTATRKVREAADVERLTNAQLIIVAVLIVAAIIVWNLRESVPLICEATFGNWFDVSETDVFAGRCL